VRLLPSLTLFPYTTLFRSHLESVFVELKVRLGLAVEVVKPLVGVVSGIAVVIENIAVHAVCSAAGGNDDVGATIAALFGRGAQRDRAKLLHVVGIQALDVPLRIRDSGLVCVNAVDSDVVRTIARTKDVRV